VNQAQDKRHIEIDVNDNSVYLNINSVFYPQQAILSVTQRFTDKFWAEVIEKEEKEGELTVKLRPRSDCEEEDLKQLGREFMNHLLSEVHEG